jgi:hypothetical protein
MHILVVDDDGQLAKLVHLFRLFPRARELSASSGCHEAVTAVAVS